MKPSCAPSFAPAQAPIGLLILLNALFFTGAALLPRVPPRAWMLPAVANAALALALWYLRRRSKKDSIQHAAEWPAAMLALDARGRISHGNQAARAMLGLDAAGEGSLAAVTHPDEAELNARLLSAMSLGTVRDGVQARRCFGRGGALLHTRWQLSFANRRAGEHPTATVLVEDISLQRALEGDLERARQSLHDLHSIVTGQQLEEQVGALLDLGRRRFGVETAFVSQRREGKLRLLEVRSDDPRLRRATSYSLHEAAHDGALRRPLGPRGLAHVPFEEVAESGEMVPGAVFVHAGETYLGAPIVVEAAIWGGLHFSDAEGRAAIAEEDQRFLGTMAAWLGSEIERRQVKARLEEQQKELLQAAITLENLAVRDGLTGAYNRRAFDEHLASEWARARRYKTPLSLILLDVDKFKSFNDSFGHPAGDEVLKKVAQALGDAIRNIDFLARYGGEEFVLLLPSTDEAGALIVAERLRTSIESASWMLRPVTSSFGVATLQSQMDAPAVLLKAADEALYRSKEAGRNRVTAAWVAQVSAAPC